MKFTVLFILTLLLTAAQAQDEDWQPYANKAEFENSANHIGIDSVHNTITTNNYFTSWIAPTFKQEAGKEQQRNIMAHGDWSTTGAYRALHDAYENTDSMQLYTYLVSTRYKIANDTFVLDKQTLRLSQAPLKPDNELLTGIRQYADIPDSATFYKLRSATDTFVLNHIPANQVAAQIIKPAAGYLVIVSVEPSIHNDNISKDPNTPVTGMVQFFKKTGSTYVKYFETLDYFNAFALLHFKGQNDMALLLQYGFCYQDCDNNYNVYLLPKSKTATHLQRFLADFGIMH